MTKKKTKKKGKEKRFPSNEEEKQKHEDKSKEEFELFKYRKKEYLEKGYYIKTKTLINYKEENEKDKINKNKKKNKNYNLQLHEEDNRRSFSNQDLFNLPRNPFTMLNKKEIKIENQGETKNETEEDIIQESVSERDND